MIELLVLDFHALSWTEADALTFSQLSFKVGRLAAHRKMRLKTQKAR